MDNPDFDIYHGSLYARFDYIAIKARKLQERQEHFGYQKLSRSMPSKISLDQGSPFSTLPYLGLVEKYPNHSRYKAAQRYALLPAS
ncbi:hypothetical protein GX50_00027 [[Emmonsia] crescens]|uniref:Uncharacterized protein n=1 Tax=[Emmonsia] crescens TaxID=73230 RepID=A0A2B7ZKK8_9EURO|nr:hypothetical protein GX50_00027 [Emmonsia crescens]